MAVPADSCQFYKVLVRKILSNEVQSINGVDYFGDISSHFQILQNVFGISKLFRAVVFCRGAAEVQSLPRCRGTSIASLIRGHLSWAIMYQ